MPLPTLPSQARSSNGLSNSRLEHRAKRWAPAFCLNRIVLYGSRADSSSPRRTG